MVFEVCESQCGGRPKSEDVDNPIRSTERPLLSSYLLLYLTCTGETGFEPASSCLGGMCSSVELLARDVRTKQYGPDGVRTRILMIRSHALIQLSYEANARNRTCTCTNSVVSGVFYF